MNDRASDTVVNKQTRALPQFHLRLLTRVRWCETHRFCTTSS